MTWKMTDTCKQCGATFEIEVWDLGHKESDSLICQFCSHEIRKWKNEARSYSIIKVITPGTIQQK